MIQANELRIGNLVLDGEEPIKIDIVSLRYMVDNKGIEIFRPVRLTEEWLIKLGAKEVGITAGVFQFDRFYLRWHPQFKYWYVTESRDSAYITKVEYVHEWQNVVFTLNGEELEVKP